MADSQKQYKDGLSTTEEAKSQLKDFVKVVDQYQQYQDKQKDLLIKAQSTSKTNPARTQTACGDSKPKRPQL